MLAALLMHHHFLPRKKCDADATAVAASAGHKTDCQLCLNERRTSAAADPFCHRRRLPVILKDCTDSLTYLYYRFLYLLCLSVRLGCRGSPQWLVLLLLVNGTTATADVDKSERFLDGINLDSIAAVFNKVAYGSTTKRSIPDGAYSFTTLATPLLTTYRYNDGGDEYYRVDVKKPDSFEPQPDEDEVRRGKEDYGSDLERDHTLPTSAPAADILKNNNNKNYNNPNRYNNDRLRPDYVERVRNGDESVTERFYPTSVGPNVRNVRPTKSMFDKEIPSYVPPSRTFFTPPLPPAFVNPFADKPTLRGTNSEGFQNRRPIPPPSLMPKKDRIPFRRPDLPNKEQDENVPPESKPDTKNAERKKTLNTPSHNVNVGRIGEFYGLNHLPNNTNFEYEPIVNIPSISRILSGSNGRKEEIPDVLLRQVTATPTRNVPTTTTTPPPPRHHEGRKEGPNISTEVKTVEPKVRDVDIEPVVVQDTTTVVSDIYNLPNVKEKTNKDRTKEEVSNVTKTSSYEVWHICWNVHVYLVVFLYFLLAAFSIVKLIRFDSDSHMFSKTHFISIHLLLAVICTLRIFYLAYDPYNIGKSLPNFIYDLLHNFPLSLLATTFALLIVFLLKRTLNHLKVKTRPVFLVAFGIGHIVLCLCLNIAESLSLFGHNTVLGLVCRFVFILLCWALGLSYLYLYHIIKNVLAKKSQNLSEVCTQNISYASHVTIAIALLFILMGAVQIYGLFIKVDKFVISYHWILWGFELSIRVLEISIIALLAIVVSLRMSQREKQNVAFPLFPCTTSDSSADNMYPNNCSTNLNALNYSLRSQYRQDRITIPTDVVERPNLLKAASTAAADDPGRSSDTDLERQKYDRSSLRNEHRSGNNSDFEGAFERFERPKWGSQKLESEIPVRNYSRSEFPTSERSSSRNKNYDKSKYYVKPKYDTELYNNDDYQHDNVYSEPLDLDRSDFERRSRNSCNTSGRRSGRSGRKANCRPNLGAQTLPAQQDSMLVDENGFVRFRHLGELELPKRPGKPDASPHYSDT